MLILDEKIPVVVDADYNVVSSSYGGKPIVHDGMPYISAKRRRDGFRIIKYVVSSIWSVVIWSFKLVASLMVEGVSGTVDGIKEASSAESRRVDDCDRRRERSKKPFWYIPTKEEEEMQKYSRGDCW